MGEERLTYVCRNIKDQSLPFLFLFPWTEIHKNVISPLEGDTKEPEIHKKHTDLKQKMRDLSHGFERLRKLSHEGFTEDSGERSSPAVRKPNAALVVSRLGSGDKLMVPCSRVEEGLKKRGRPVSSFI